MKKNRPGELASKMLSRKSATVNVHFKLLRKNSRGSRGRVRGVGWGRETWNLCGHLWWPSFYCPQQSCEGYVLTPVCLSTGGVCLSAYWDTPSQSRHPPGSRPPIADIPPPQQTPYPLEQTPPKQTPPQADGYWCGWYASFWNAFLFMTNFYRAGGGHGPLGLPGSGTEEITSTRVPRWRI